MKCHNYTYNSFIIDMTDIANFGTVPNTIAVFIDARSWEGWWYEGAGIYRSVWLYKKSAVHMNIKLKGTCNHHDQAGAGGIKNGTILGVGNGNPNSREADVAENRQLFHGRAQLIVRNTGVETVEIAVSCGIADMVHVSIPVCETADSVPYILPVQNQILDGWKLYHKLFDEMPDANLQADVNDMNSFEPISFQGTPQPLFEGHPHSYGMYQVTFLLPAQQRRREISFPHVMGAAWVYLNGKLVHDSSRDMETRFVIPLPENLSGTQEMTVILQNKGENLSGCGIIEPVRLNVK